MFSHRRAVSLKMIRETCGIPRRTAFRYLNAISEANIPIYFDRERGGYCLAALLSRCVQKCKKEQAGLRLKLITPKISPWH
ncbi:MAG: hypothetical protein IPH75_14730 [bacterium]|nr:hypothetical protein [bacterium]